VVWVFAAGLVHIAGEWSQEDDWVILVVQQLRAEWPETVFFNKNFLSFSLLLAFFCFFSLRFERHFRLKMSFLLFCENMRNNHFFAISLPLHL
jgi:hypothetical protein